MLRSKDYFFFFLDWDALQPAPPQPVLVSSLSPVLHVLLQRHVLLQQFLSPFLFLHVQVDQVNWPEDEQCAEYTAEEAPFDRLFPPAPAFFTFSDGFLRVLFPRDKVLLQHISHEKPFCLFLPTINCKTLHSRRVGVPSDALKINSVYALLKGKSRASL